MSDIVYGVCGFLPIFALLGLLILARHISADPRHYPDPRNLPTLPRAIVRRVALPRKRSKAVA